MQDLRNTIWLAFAPVMILAVSTASAQKPVPTRPSSRPSLLGEPYLAAEERPDSIALAPPPPPKGSAAAQRDEALAVAAIRLRGSARWELATRDANLDYPVIAHAFASAGGLPAGIAEAPAFRRLLTRSATDLAYSPALAKKRYGRSRPFTVNNAAICTPEQRDVLLHDASYPSGHAAIGWGLALILAELAPDHATAILARGRAFGDSRVVCNVHWQSDVEEGRILAAATVARLHAKTEFAADLAGVRQLLVRDRRQAVPVTSECATPRTLPTPL